MVGWFIASILSAFHLASEWPSHPRMNWFKMWATQCKPNIDLQQLLGLIKATRCLKKEQQQKRPHENMHLNYWCALLWHSLLQKILI